MTDTIRDQLAEYVAGTLTDEQRAATEAHLATCAACRAELRAWQRLAAAVRLSTDVTNRHLPPLNAAIATVAPDGLDASAKPKRRGPWRGASGGLVILAAILTSSSGRPVNPQALAHLPAEAVASVAPVGVPGAGQHRQPASPSHQPKTTDQRLAPPSAVGRGREATSRPPSVAVPPSSSPAAAEEVPPPAALLQLGMPESPTDGVQRGDERVADRPAVAAGDDDGAIDAVVSSPDRGKTTATSSPPAPAPAASAAVAQSTGWIVGRVTGPDGRGRAEIPVTASTDDGRRAPDGVAYTDLTGHYALPVPPGRWIVHVDAPAYRLQWYPRSPTPFGAASVAVQAGAWTDDVDFALTGNPPACVVGRVTGPDGSPVPRALVLALPAIGAGVTVTGTVPLGVAFTAADGTYRLFVEPGVAVVGASPSVLLPPADWWRGKSTARQADGLLVREGERKTAVDFVLDCGGRSASASPASPVDEGRSHDPRER